MKGRLLPLGWWHFLHKGRIIDRVRVGFLGVKPEYQHTGVAAQALPDALRRRRSAPPEGRRDGLDPRDEHGDEPRHGSDGRARSSSATGCTSGSSRLSRAWREDGWARRSAGRGVRRTTACTSGSSVLSRAWREDGWVATLGRARREADGPGVRGSSRRSGGRGVRRTARSRRSARSETGGTIRGLERSLHFAE